MASFKTTSTDGPLAFSPWPTHIEDYADDGRSEPV